MTITGYGADYEMQISRAMANKLTCGLLPNMGQETLIRRVFVRACGHDWPTILWLQNISGTYVLACSSEPREKWPRLFDVHPDKKGFDEIFPEDFHINRLLGRVDIKEWAAYNPAQ